MAIATRDGAIATREVYHLDRRRSLPEEANQGPVGSAFSQMTSTCGLGEGEGGGNTCPWGGTARIRFGQMGCRA